MKVMVLAGGFGTRLQTVVNEVPKPLAPVNGRPFLDFVLKAIQRQLESANIILLLHHMADKIIDFAKSCSFKMEPKYPLDWIVEETPLGTGGAIANAIRFFSVQEPFLVLNADTYLNGGIRTIVSSGPNSVGVVNVPDTGRYGSVVFDANWTITSFAEKSASGVSGWINSGIYYISPLVFKNSTETAFSLEKKIFPKMVQNKNLKAVPVDCDFIDIGIPEDYYKFCNLTKSMGDKCNGSP